MEESTRLVGLFARRWSGPQHLPTVGPLVSARFSEATKTARQEYVCVRLLLMLAPSRG